MKPLSLDTPLDVERVWLSGLRQQGPLERLRRLVSITSLCWRAAHDACCQARPKDSDSAQDFWLLQERYGRDLAQQVVDLRRQRGFYDGEP